MSKRVPMREMVLVCISKRTGREVSRRNKWVRVTDKSLIADFGPGRGMLFTHEGRQKSVNIHSMEFWRLEPMSAEVQPEVQPEGSELLLREMAGMGGIDDEELIL